MRAVFHRVFLSAVVSGLALLVTSIAAQDISTADVAAGLANPARWLTYSGDYTGQRHSPLTQITPANVGQLSAQWTFQTGISGHKFEATPIVIDGVMYVTGPLNAAWAIDARTGRQIWRLPADAARAVGARRSAAVSSTGGSPCTAIAC